MSDEIAIRELHEKWIALERQGLHSECLQFCTDDVVIQPPFGVPIAGRSAVERQLLASNEPIESIETYDLNIEIGADIAVKRARFRTRLAGSSLPIVGSHFWFLRRREGGWRVAFVAWSLDRKS